MREVDGHFSKTDSLIHFYRVFGWQRTVLHRSFRLKLWTHIFDEIDELACFIIEIYIERYKRIFHPEIERLFLWKGEYHSAGLAEISLIHESLGAFGRRVGDLQVPFDSVTIH